MWFNRLRATDRNGLLGIYSLCSPSRHRRLYERLKLQTFTHCSHSHFSSFFANSELKPVNLYLFILHTYFAFLGYLFTTFCIFFYNYYNFWFSGMFHVSDFRPIASERKYLMVCNLKYLHVHKADRNKLSFVRAGNGLTAPNFLRGCLRNSSI